MHQGYKLFVEQLIDRTIECRGLIADLRELRRITDDEERMLNREIEYCSKMHWLDTLTKRCQELMLMKELTRNHFEQFVSQHGL